MTGELLVTPEQLDTASQEFQSAMTQVMTIHQEMTDLVKGLTARWQGEASDVYQAKFVEATRLMEELQKMINEHVRDLSDMAAKYREAEQKNDEVANSLNPVLG